MTEGETISYCFMDILVASKINKFLESTIERNHSTKSIYNYNCSYNSLFYRTKRPPSPT